MKLNKFFTETKNGLIIANCESCISFSKDPKNLVFDEPYYGECSRLFNNYRIGNPTRTVNEIRRKSIDDLCEKFQPK